MTTTRRVERQAVCLSCLRKTKKVSALNLRQTPFLVISKFAVAQTDCSKITYAFAGGLVKNHGIGGFRSHPHATPRAMLLKMNFIFCPKIHARILHHSFQFFLCRLCNSGSAWAIRGRARVIESPTVETTVGIGAPLAPRGIASQ